MTLTKPPFLNIFFIVEQFSDHFHDALNQILSLLLFNWLFLLNLSFSCGTRNGKMETSRWCTAPACVSLTGATPSSPSLTPTIPCCSCPASTWGHTTRLLGKLPSLVWVGTWGKTPARLPVDAKWRFVLGLKWIRARSFHLSILRLDSVNRRTVIHRPSYKTQCVVED